MAAPSTPLLDNFNRANGAIGASWKAAQIDTNLHNLATINTNAVFALATQSAVWGTAVGDDQECYATFTQISTTPDLVEMWCRITNDGTAAPNGYVARATWVGAGTDTFKLYKVVAGAYTQIGSTYTGTFATNDKLAVQAIGTTVNLYHFTSAAWNLRVTTTDSSQTTGGIGFFGTSNAGNVALDDFSGGTLVTAIAAYPLPTAAQVGYTN